VAQHQRDAPEQCRHRGHHDRSEAQQASLIDRLFRPEVLIALGIEREIDHHDRVLFDDPDQQNDSNEGDHAQVVLEQHQHDKRTNARRRQR